MNRSSLDVIERAQFALCLDRAHPQTASYSPECEFQDFHKGILANRFLHGNGSQHNSCNRWFDAIQVSLSFCSLMQSVSCNLVVCIMLFTCVPRNDITGSHWGRWRVWGITGAFCS